MKLTMQKSTLTKYKADAITVFVHEDKKTFDTDLKNLNKIFGKKLDEIIELENFKGKENEIVSVYTDRKISAPRLFLVGLGELKKISLEQYRRAAATTVKRAKASKVKHLAFSFPDPHNTASFSIEDIAGAITEGAVLGHYKFDKYFTEKNNKDTKISEITIFDSDGKRVTKIKRGLSYARIICEAVYLARDLENAPGNEIYPETLADTAARSAIR
ncbi:MAG TPA: M17 family peptidase N-terminal domain-containing protein, partial [Bacteroidota bacterium]|nr:M17 family peptidase N-terminal domain-containing protein [Bacteroidota bacterium]